ncbi:MAG: tRNA lysidine(34) synthetase TilS [Nitrospira sp.]|nr:tRNA lysidine(34) synthetase TilS [Nitrospira sp.]
MAAPPTAVHHPLHNQVVRALRARALLQPGQSVLVAVSGGPDSVALLSILRGLAAAWKLSLTVVHCNYGLRGIESDEDAAFVAALCRRLKVPCLVRSLRVRDPEAGASSSLQARARELRYHLFRDLAKELQVDRVALGHTADDQAETVLLRMLRGAGLRGLAGMPHSRERLFVRPLLGVTRREILSYLQTVGLSYRTDSSNAKPLYLRNRVRQEVLPLLASLAPAATRMLARQADILRADDQLLDRLAARCLRKVTQRRDATMVILDRAAFRRQPMALQPRMLRLAIQALAPASAGLRSDQVLSILASVGTKRSGHAWEVGPVTVISDQGTVEIMLRAERPLPSVPGTGSPSGAPVRNSEEVTLHSLPSTASWLPTGEVIRVRPVTPTRGLALLKHPSSAAALFDADRLTLPLTIRSWRRGDWFVPTGMAGRRKKLQDYFTDAKLGRSMREHIPLLLSHDQIAWIVGRRIDARFAADASTIRFIVARVTCPVPRKGVC